MLQSVHLIIPNDSTESDLQDIAVFGQHYIFRNPFIYMRNPHSIFIGNYNDFGSIYKLIHPQWPHLMLDLNSGLESIAELLHVPHSFDCPAINPVRDHSSDVQNWRYILVRAVPVLCMRMCLLIGYL